MSSFSCTPRLLSAPCTTSAPLLSRHSSVCSAPRLSLAKAKRYLVRLPFFHTVKMLGLSTSHYLLAVNVSVASELGDEGAKENSDTEATAGPESPILSPDLKVFVGNLSYTVDSSVLAGLFGQVGDVEMVEVIYDRETGRHRGFGFVTMSTMDGVQAAVRLFNGYVFEGRPLRVNSGPPDPNESFFSKANRGKSKGAANRIIVNNLAWDVDDNALMAFFSKHGKVVRATVVYDKENGRSKGFGFVTYSTEEEANNAIDTLYGMELNGRSIRLSTAEYRPRGTAAAPQTPTNITTTIRGDDAMMET